jgi:hypothetical protein
MLIEVLAALTGILCFPNFKPTCLTTMTNLLEASQTLDAGQIFKTTAMSIMGGSEEILDEWLDYLRTPYQS